MNRYYGHAHVVFPSVPHVEAKIKQFFEQRQKDASSSEVNCLISCFLTAVKEVSALPTTPLPTFEVVPPVPAIPSEFARSNPTVRVLFTVLTTQPTEVPSGPVFMIPQTDGPQL